MEGVDTSVPFHLRVMDEPDFRAGRLTIKYLENHEDLLTAEPDEQTVRMAALTAALLEEERRTHRAMPRTQPATAGTTGGSAWRGNTGGWRGR